MTHTTTGTLYIVATPIGNSSDITLRALETLKRVDFICAEDTRVISKLLSIHGIEGKKLISLNEFANVAKVDSVVADLQEGKDVAFVSDAGTPGISDPAGLLVSRTREMGVDISIVPIPGASAITTLMSVSGLRETPFLFYGFLPHKKGRQKILDELMASPYTIVLYESPHRYIKLLEELKAREHESCTISLVVGRELTKMYEDIRTGTPSDILEYATAHLDTVRGEFVLIIQKLRI